MTATLAVNPFRWLLRKLSVAFVWTLIVLACCIPLAGGYWLWQRAMSDEYAGSMEPQQALGYANHFMATAFGSQAYFNWRQDSKVARAKLGLGLGTYRIFYKNWRTGKRLCLYVWHPHLGSPKFVYRNAAVKGACP